jgi:tetratricopeptide (TPR) repeat protein
MMELLFDQSLKRGVSGKRAWRKQEYYDLEKSMIAVSKVLLKNPRDFEALAAKADLLYLGGRYEEALTWCERSLNENDENAFAWNTRGNVLYKLSRYDEAEASYSRAIEIEPFFMRARYNRDIAAVAMASAAKAESGLSRLSVIR